MDAEVGGDAAEEDGGAGAELADVAAEWGVEGDDADIVGESAQGGDGEEVVAAGSTDKGAGTGR